jgi:hypothetical protein
MNRIYEDCAHCGRDADRKLDDDRATLISELETRGFKLLADDDWNVILDRRWRFYKVEAYFPVGDNDDTDLMHFNVEKTGFDFTFIPDSLDHAREFVELMGWVVRKPRAARKAA